MKQLTNFLITLDQNPLDVMLLLRRKVARVTQCSVMGQLVMGSPQITTKQQQCGERGALQCCGVQVSVQGTLQQQGRRAIISG